MSQYNECNSKKSSRKSKSQYKLNDDYYQCECKKKFNNPQSLNAHFSHCLIHRKGKPSKRSHEIERKMAGWDKFSKEEKTKMAENAGKTLSKKILSGEITPAFQNKKHSIESKRKISESRTKFLETSNSNGIKWFKIHNGIEYVNVQGTWEKAVAEWLNNRKIVWTRKKLYFNQHRRYTPDFYLPDFNVYLEVKGFMKNNDICKMYACLNHNDVKILLIEKNEINNISKLNIQDLPNFVDKYKLSDVDKNFINNYI
jgi:hypothetical protein